jgi:hypothetical protein
MHAQFNSQNPLGCPITNSHLISKVLNGSTLILTNELLKFGNSVARCAADGPTSVLAVHLNRACHSNTPAWLMLSSPNVCLIIARVSTTLFLIFAQNLMHTHCSFVGFIVNSHQPRYKTPNKRT